MSSDDPPAVVHGLCPHGIDRDVHVCDQCDEDEAIAESIHEADRQEAEDREQALRDADGDDHDAEALHDAIRQEHEDLPDLRELPDGEDAVPPVDHAGDLTEEEVQSIINGEPIPDGRDLLAVDLEDADYVCVHGIDSRDRQCPECYAQFLRLIGEDH